MIWIALYIIGFIATGAHMSYKGYWGDKDGDEAGWPLLAFLWPLALIFFYPHLLGEAARERAKLSAKAAAEKTAEVQRIERELTMELARVSVGFKDKP